MKKSIINKYCRRFGFEIHGTGYMQSLQKASFRDDAFAKQMDLAGENTSVIFDVGANRGDIALQYHSLFSKATVYAFEPFEETYNDMQAKISGTDKIKAYQLAIADARGEKTFFINHNADTNSLLMPQKMGLSSDKEVANKGKVTVSVTTIDNFCQEQSIHQIDILKLDIQGGELAALQGASDMLANKKINLIYTEAYFRRQYVDQPLFHDISKYLQQFGYFLQDIYNPIYGKGSIAWCDAIFTCG